MNLDQEQSIAAVIDHTLLKPEATGADVVRICEEARQHHFASVCINPSWVRLAAAELRGSGVRICTVIGFPLGANEARVKQLEAELALSEGAEELDMVQNIGALRSRDFDLVRGEIGALADLAHKSNSILKVILETSLLTDDEKTAACRLAVEAHADFVKTSTGFSTGGATVSDIVLMRRIVGPALGVKASGGVRTLATLRDMIRAGANRIGTSSGIGILDELRESSASSSGVSSLEVRPATAVSSQERADTY